MYVFKERHSLISSLTCEHNKTLSEFHNHDNVHNWDVPTFFCKHNINLPREENLHYISKEYIELILFFKYMNNTMNIQHGKCQNALSETTLFMIMWPISELLLNKFI